MPASSSGGLELTEQHSLVINASAVGTGHISFLSGMFTVSSFFYLSRYRA